MHVRLREIWIWGRTLSPRKLWNAVLLTASYYVARLLRRPIHWGQPASVGIEPTTACNLRCPHCPSGLRSFSRPTGRLSFERFQALVDELHPTLLYLILYFQGEPYLNPDFLRMARYAAGRGVFTMSSTNAHFLDPERARQTVESRLGRLVISMDGTTQQTYEQYRVGGNFEKVLTGTRNLVAAKRAAHSPYPFIDLQFIVFRHNQHQIEEARRLGRQLGVDRVSIKTAQIYDFENQDGWIPTNEQHSRYTLTAAGYRIKNRLMNHCWKLWHAAEITWDGRVLPCCFDKDAQYEMGRFPERRFREIWRGRAYRDFRQRLLRSRGEIDICRNCTEGTKIWS